jgi:hypothetical protein
LGSEQQEKKKKKLNSFFFFLFFFRTGEKYCGHFLDGEKHGFGKLIYSSGNVYEGGENTLLESSN